MIIFVILFLIVSLLSFSAGLTLKKNIDLGIKFVRKWYDINLDTEAIIISKDMIIKHSICMAVIYASYASLFLIFPENIIIKIAGILIIIADIIIIKRRVGKIYTRSN